MKRKPRKPRVLVVDVGGTSVKCICTGRKKRIKLRSGKNMGPKQMMPKLRMALQGWRYDVVTIGYPGVVRGGKITREPNNLGSGWIGFDFAAAFGCPVKLINDAAMQALGGYRGGKMLFLGLGTGLGSALIVDGVVVPMELGHLHCSLHHTYEHFLGDAGRKRLGQHGWRARVVSVVRGFSLALLPDDILLGGGNVKKLERLPPQTRRGGNADAFTGGFRLWESRNYPGTPELTQGFARPVEVARHAWPATDFALLTTHNDKKRRRCRNGGERKEHDGGSWQGAILRCGWACVGRSV